MMFEQSNDHHGSKALDALSRCYKLTSFIIIHRAMSCLCYHASSSLLIPRHGEFNVAKERVYDSIAPSRYT